MRAIDFKYHLLDKNNNLIKPLFNIESCTITYSSLFTLKSTANLKMKNDNSIDFMNDRIKVICRLNNIDYPLGIYIITSPNKDKNEDLIYRDIYAYSPIVLLQRDKMQTRYFLPQGSNIIAEVKRLLGTHSYNIEEGTFISAINKEFEVGTPIIEIINDLLSSINYTSLYVDVNGVFSAKKYVLPSDRNIEIEYKEGKGSILHKTVREDMDLFNIPNIFIRYTNNPNINPPLIARYENNRVDSLTSTVNTSPNVDAQEVVDVVDINVLQDICKKDAYNASQIYSHLEFESAINPVHSYLNCLYVKYGDIDNKYIETSWEIECRVGGRMKHIARRVVNI
ncbi:hypothetical protein [Cellulosilyticum sp. I15G10I2]|uniref:hypothetical protein n=1 Tax=Cellulosilyticum sp. I15G10I2 TaxID=1892843 RepID=UPI00085C57D8|nr:hypothetical protein [Cellulosilyticum sp. I15G10I2]